jgi:hypothetical protein
VCVSSHTLFATFAELKATIGKLLFGRSLRANCVILGKDQGNCAVIVQRHYLEARSETSTATEEAGPLGWCIPGGSLGKSSRVERGKDACHNVHNSTISGGFLQEKFFRIFLSP